VKRKPNPIIVAAERGLRKEQQLSVWLGKWDELPWEAQFDIVRRFFTDEAIYEIGCLVLGSLVAGDKQMALKVRDAIKHSNHMFGRDRELELLKSALRYTLCNWDLLLHKNRGSLQRTVEDIKKGIEQHYNRGKELDQYRWTRLRRALALPKRSCLRHDGKPVKLVELGEIIDLAPPRAKKRRRRSTKRHKTVS
jgi:hypothetical protein